MPVILPAKPAVCSGAFATASCTHACFSAPLVLRKTFNGRLFQRASSFSRQLTEMEGHFYPSAAPPSVWLPANNAGGPGGGGRGGGRGRGGDRRGRGRGKGGCNSGSNNNKRRNRRRKDRRSNQGNRGPPQTPQLKVTIRNICDTERNGNIQKVIDLVMNLVNRTNDALTAPGGDHGFVGKLHLDQTSFERILLEEQAILNAAEKAAEENATEATEDQTGISEEVANEKTGGQEVESEATETSTVPTVPEENLISLTNQKLNIDANHKSGTTDASKIVTVRVLYAVPPKKTRRRGEKPGCAYVLLVAPPIKEIIDPKDDAAPSSNESMENSTPSKQSSAIVDYCREVSQKRLMLNRAVEVMAHVAVLDSKSKKELAGCMVEESINVKTWTWKPSNHRDRLEGTIEESEDFKRFQAKNAKAVEERMARPKPAPGGGTLAAVSAAGTAGTSETGQPMAAIVLHLKARQEQEKKRKKAKRRAKDASKKGASKEGGNAKNNEGSRSKAARDRKKYGKRGKKKKKGPKNATSAKDGD